MMILLVLVGATLFGSGSCEYNCLCNYHVELNVLGPDHQQTLGYLYEFDCKPVVEESSGNPWVAVAFEHQLGYVQKDAQVQIQTCPGDPPTDDLLPTDAITSSTQNIQTRTSTATTGTLPSSSVTPTTTEALTSSKHSVHTKPTTTTAATTTTTTTTTQMPSATVRPTTTTTHMPTTSTTYKSTTTTTSILTTFTTTTQRPATTSTGKITTTTTTTPTPTVTSTTTRPTTTATTSTVKMSTSTPTTRSPVTHNELTHVNVCPQFVQEYAKDDNSILTTYGHNCYEIVTHVATWNHAEVNCRQKGGHLVDINSQTEQTFINNFLQSSNFHHNVWIGLHDQNHQDQFQWVSGNAVTYTDFYHGFFDFLFHESEDCVVMSNNHNGQWDDIECDNKLYNYICQYLTVDSSTIHVTTPDPSMISEGNIHLCPSAAQHDASQFHGVLGQYDRSCYELLPVQEVTWAHGEAHCRNSGGHLAYISNKQEQDFIQRFMKAHFPNHAVWIGLHDSNVEGHFQWTSGNAVRYTNWVPGHTSNFVSHWEEDCVAFIPYQNGQWDDIPCGGQGIFGGDNGETHPVLCQYKISASVVPVGK